MRLVRQSEARILIVTALTEASVNVASAVNPDALRAPVQDVLDDLYDQRKAARLIAQRLAASASEIRKRRAPSMA